MPFLRNNVAAWLCAGQAWIIRLKVWINWGASPDCNAWNENLLNWETASQQNGLVFININIINMLWMQSRLGFKMINACLLFMMTIVLNIFVAWISIQHNFGCKTFVISRSWKKFWQAGFWGVDNWCFAGTIKSPFPARRQMDVYIFTATKHSKLLNTFCILHLGAYIGTLHTLTFLNQYTFCMYYAHTHTHTWEEEVGDNPV